MAAGKSDKETPLMKQYYSIKAQYPGAILLFRVGDFYETFNEDARTASAVLGIVLTKRANGGASEMDLAGFPHHSLDNYLPKLVKAGYRVAICDQLEDPKATKTIVKRGVTELVTPGVSYNDKVLNNKQNNYLCSLYEEGNRWGIAFLDISTGEFFCSESGWFAIKKLIDALKPAELLIPKNQQELAFTHFGKPSSYQTLDSWIYEFTTSQETLTKHFQTQSLKGFGIDGQDAAIAAAAACLHYLQQTQHHHVAHIRTIRRIDEQDHVWIDGFTQRNLELLQPIYSGGTAFIDVLDQTCTPMGARLLRQWVVFPLLDILKIQHRQNQVEAFLSNALLREQLRGLLKQIGDQQRLVSKVALRKISPREAVQLGNSLRKLSAIKDLLAQSSNDLLVDSASKINTLP
ncbi:MAG: hypothetical protein RLZZ252_692, partial [Bacteroidota bacterium]